MPSIATAAMIRVNPGVNPDVNLSALRTRLQRARAAAIARFRTDHRADTLLAALRRATDQTLRDLVRAYPLPPGASLTAVGGYGRGELYPGSDVDVLILLPAAPDPVQTQAIERLIAALWDSGLEPSSSVRTIVDCQREAAADITIETALLESRWLVGSRKLMHDFQAAMWAQLDARRFFAAKRAEMRARHARYQNTAYALEPHCKESPGGLRDLQVIGWMARAAGFGQTWRRIAASGLLTEQEARALRRAEQAFKRLRIELHLLAGRREDRLLFEWQAALAQAYGINARARQRASEQLMQRYYWAARQVTQLNVILVQNLEERLGVQAQHEEAGAGACAVSLITPAPATPIDGHWRVIHGRLDIDNDEAFAREPALLLRAFLVMQQNPKLSDFSARTLRAIWHHRRGIDATFRRDPHNQALFLRILQQPRGVLRALERMNQLNVLPRYLPAFRRVVGLIQHNLFHAYTVDQHSLIVIGYLRRFARPHQAVAHPLAHQLMTQFEQPWLLYVAALFHDIAKGRDGDHSELGAQAVRRFARQHRFARTDAALVAFLVRQHLLMSQVAQKQDLSDPAVIHAFARTVGTPRRLAALYLLTVADICGTHPKLWNAWKAKLLADLYTLTHAVLTQSVRSDARAVLAQRKQSAARLARLAGVPERARQHFWQQLDGDYFLRHSDADIAWHTQSLHAASPAAQVVTTRLVQDYGEQHASAIQVLVATPDRAELFETLCAYFDAHGFSVQDARIHTTGAGWAIDSFIVLARHDGEAATQLAAHIEATLADWLLARAPAWRASHRAHSVPARQSRQFPVTPQLLLQADEHAPFWQLSLIATDRPGLLHAIAQVLRAHGVNLRSAKIMTLGARIEDVFRVEAAVLANPTDRQRFEQQLLDTLAGFPSTPSCASQPNPSSATLPAVRSAKRSA